MNETTINKLKEHGYARFGAASSIHTYEVSSDPEVRDALHRIIEMIAECSLPDEWEESFYAIIKMTLERKYPILMGLTTDTDSEEESGD